MLRGSNLRSSTGGGIVKVAQRKQKLVQYLNENGQLKLSQKLKGTNR